MDTEAEQPTMPETQPPIPQAIPPKPQPNRLLIAIIVIIIVSAVAIVDSYLTGFKKGQSQSSPTPYLPENPAPTMTSNITPTIDPTSTWRTYTHPTYHFSLKYPQSYEIANINNGIIISDPQNIDKPQISVTVNQTSLSAQEYAQSANLCKQNLCTEIKKGLLPDSIEYASVQTVHYQSIDTLVKQGNQIFDISLNAKIASRPFSFEETTLYTQILSTFQFTQ